MKKGPFWGPFALGGPIRRPSSFALFHALGCETPEVLRQPSDSAQALSSVRPQNSYLAETCIAQADSPRLFFVT